MTYDERGNMLSRTLPLGVETTGNPSDFAETNEYDDLGRQTLHVSFEGKVTQSVYDPLTGRLSEQRFFGNLTDYAGGSGTPNETWTYKYDAFDRPVEVTQDDGTTMWTTTTTYDAQGRVASISSPEGVVNYQYDVATGQRARTYTTDPNNPTSVIDDTHYTYDVMGRLSSVELVEQNGVAVSPAQTTTDKYDLAGNLREQDDPNGSTVDYVYNDLNQLVQETQYASDGTTKLAQYDYTLEADGKRTAAMETFWWDDNSDGVPDPHVNNLTWTYDADGRLTEEILSSYDPSLSYIDDFTLDLVGNNLAKTRNWTDPAKPDETIASTFDANDRLLTSTDTPSGGTATTTTYDYGPGNAWTVETGETAVTGSVTTRSVVYKYNLQGQLSQATVKTCDPSTDALTSDQQSTYGYNASGGTRERVGADRHAAQRHVRPVGADRVPQRPAERNRLLAGSPANDYRPSHRQGAERGHVRNRSQPDQPDHDALYQRGRRRPGNARLRLRRPRLSADAAGHDRRHRHREWRTATLPLRRLRQLAEPFRFTSSDSNSLRGRDVRRRHGPV